MKTLFFIAFVSFGLTLTSATVAHSDDLDNSVKEFELEMDRVDMRELEGQTQVATDEAQHQEQLERQHKQDLKDLSAKKARLATKARTKIASAEYRRSKAEKAVAKYDVEISHLKKQIKGLEQVIAERETRAEDAEALAAEEREELNEYRQERRDLLKRVHHHRAPASQKQKDDLAAYQEYDQGSEGF